MESTAGMKNAPKIDFDTWRKAILSSQLETEKYGFKANIIENHDEPRGVSRFLPEYAQKSCRNQDAWNRQRTASRHSVYIPGTGNRYAKCKMEQHR